MLQDSVRHLWRFKRCQFGGPGSVVSNSKTELAGWKIIREMVKHIWPRDQPKLKARVVIAVGLLVGAKVQYSWLYLWVNTGEWPHCMHFYWEYRLGNDVL